MTSHTKKSLRTLLNKCIVLQPNERFVIVSHASLSELGEELWTIAKRITKQLSILKYSTPKKNDSELPLGLCELLQHANASIILTPNSISENAFNVARQNGTRIVVVQNASTAFIERALDANFNKLSIKSRKLADLFSIGKMLRITSPSGTEAEIAINRLKGSAETGLAHQAGEFTSIPAGEANLVLKENIDGKIVLDRIAGNRRKLSKPIVLHISKGKITQIKGYHEAELLRKNLRKFGPDSRYVREFGVGTNKNVIWGYSSREDEKANGTVHISFGRNLVTKAQGKFLEAIKGIILNPTLTIDGKSIIEDGHFSV